MQEHLALITVEVCSYYMQSIRNVRPRSSEYQNNVSYVFLLVLCTTEVRTLIPITGSSPGAHNLLFLSS